MALTKTTFSGKAEQRSSGDAGTGAGGAFPSGPAGTPGDQTTGAGKGQKKVRKYGGKVAGASPGLTEGGGALGRTGGGP